MTPLVFGTTGVNMDFVAHRQANMDADLTADYLENALTHGTPVICLEQSLTVSGAAQQLVYLAPNIDDLVIGAPTDLLGMELAIQLNALSIPKTDFNFTVKLLDGLGFEKVAMRQNVTGNASIENGNTRQYIRFIPFHKSVSFKTGGIGEIQDDKDPCFLPFAKISDAGITASGLTASDLDQFTYGRSLIGSIVVEIPAGTMTNGVVITLTPLTSGRKSAVSLMVLALEKHGAANSAPADMGNEAAKIQIG